MPRQSLPEHIVDIESPDILGRSRDMLMGGESTLHVVALDRRFGGFGLSLQARDSAVRWFLLWRQGRRRGSLRRGSGYGRGLW